MGQSVGHTSVLPAEVLELLGIFPAAVVADLTAGGGGHSRLILEKLETGRLVIVDRDPDAVQLVRSQVGEDPRVLLLNENFSDLGEFWSREELPPADGILIDAGPSSTQLLDEHRGFSFTTDAPLDMRMNPSGGGQTAADIVNSADEQELEELFYRFDERFARRIVRKISGERRKAPILTTLRLAQVVSSAVPTRGKIHPATRVFLALRAEVNGELEALSSVVPAAMDILAPGGRLAIITFHSTEDRLIKNLFRRLCKGCTCEAQPDECLCEGRPFARMITRKPVVPSDEETRVNPRSRSAKLRVVEKVERE